jgi:hypothetical protein
VFWRVLGGCLSPYKDSKDSANAGFESGLMGDLNGDAMVGVQDLLLMLESFGSICR